MIHIYNRIFTIKRIENESIVVMWMNPEPVIQNELSQKEKKEISYTNAYMCNLEERY